MLATVMFRKFQSWALLKPRFTQFTLHFEMEVVRGNVKQTTRGFYVRHPTELSAPVLHVHFRIRAVKNTPYLFRAG